MVLCMMDVQTPSSCAESSVELFAPELAEMEVAFTLPMHEVHL